MTNEEIVAAGLDGLASCSHESAEAIARASAYKSIVWAEWSEGYGPEHSMSALLRLKDRTFAVLYESEDSTGHGCQCGGSLTFHATLDEALNLGVCDYEREKVKAAVAEARKVNKGRKVKR